MHTHTHRLHQVNGVERGPPYHGIIMRMHEFFTIDIWEALLEWKFYLMKFLNLFHRVYEEQEIKANAVDVFYFLIDSLHSDPNMKTNWKRHVSLQYYVVNSSFCPIHVISGISREIMLKLTSFAHKILKNEENRHSLILRFSQLVRNEISFKLNSRKFCSSPIISKFGHCAWYTN